MRHNLNLTGADQTKPRPSAGREMPLADWQKVLTGPAPLNAGCLLLFTNYRAKQIDRVSAEPGWISFTITSCGTCPSEQNTESVFKSFLWNLFILHRVNLEGKKNPTHIILHFNCRQSIPLSFLIECTLYSGRLSGLIANWIPNYFLRARPQCKDIELDAFMTWAILNTFSCSCLLHAVLLTLDRAETRCRAG